MDLVLHQYPRFLDLSLHGSFCVAGILTGGDTEGVESNSSFVRHSRRLDPTADRDRRCQARQAQKKRLDELHRGNVVAHQPLLHGPRDRNVKESARREAARALAERYDTPQPSHEAYRLPKETRRRSPLVPHPKKSRRFRPSSSEPTSTATKITEPNPLSNIWKTLCQIRLWNLFKQNPPVVTALARLPIDPISDLNEVFPPTSAEFLPKGIPVDPDRKSPWADSWGPRPSTLRRPILQRLNTYASTHPLLVGINATGISYENLLQLIRDFGDHPVLKHAASTKFRTAVLAAVPVASAHDLTGSYIVPWSELEQVKFPPLVLEYDGNFKRIAMKLPNKTSTQVMVYFTEHYQELIKTDIVQHIMQHLPIL
ncbi:hypothetical protein B0H14DRAFT_3163570 [Mycena olivaceomarginata]|nr:hypothetical protein B0H14DRAFT_3163570 [Mycena olivaceomarginata]